MLVGISVCQWVSASVSVCQCVLVRMSVCQWVSVGVSVGSEYLSVSVGVGVC